MKNAVSALTGAIKTGPSDGGDFEESFPSDSGHFAAVLENGSVAAAAAAAVCEGSVCNASSWDESCGCGCCCIHHLHLAGSVHVGSSHAPDP